jgi:hypothetical protein
MAEKKTEEPLDKTVTVEKKVSEASSLTVPEKVRYFFFSIQWL